MAVFALTSGGAALANKIAGETGADLYLPARFKGMENSRALYFENFSKTVQNAFNTYGGLLFIMAAGIVVRTIALLLESKLSDPAVVVIDEGGSFAVSLISGHVGGANELAEKAARITGGTPVITTATDVVNAHAADLLAGQLHCVPVPFSMVKKINRSLAEGEQVRLLSRWPVPRDKVGGFLYRDNGEDVKRKVIIDREIKNYDKDALYFLPRNLVAGIGCRRGVSCSDVKKALEEALSGITEGVKRLTALATIDLKANEAGICRAADLYDLPVKVISRKQVQELQVSYEESEFVKKTIGVGGVCEPAAILATSPGRIVVHKMKLGPVTVAVAEEKLWWWD
ncbi:MAG: cobalt-precorrin 5A hydrolase [Clostridiales bacterium]|nr:cobalt-precorrin 5A hydrolase [Clostridiales bacterium]MCF8022740.1 cobalt-precorrin 5A hydrolase [Clostridiales bacterium]